MKLLQVNVWGARLGGQVVELLKEEKPDIVCLQEAVDVSGDGLMSTSTKEMSEKAQLKHSFFSAVFSFNLMNKKAGFGNAILSNLEMSTQETIFTGLQHKDDFDFDTDNGNIRNLQHAVVTVSGKEVNILNHHGHHINQHKNGDAETMRQCRLIADYIQTLKGPVILTGDFNLAPQSESLEQINNVLTNLSVKYGLKTTRNQFTYKVDVCDYIFVSPEVKVDDFRASEKLVSDHKALILEFDV